MSPTISPAERLLDLVIALTHDREHQRMTKAHIRTQVAGYRDSPSEAAFERMFERDKELLRSLGIPLITVTDPRHGDDVGYRIDTQAYAMPTIDFTPAEMGVLAIAAAAWRDAVLRGPAERGITKLRGLGAVRAEGAAGLELSVRSGGEALGPLLQAIHDRQAVSFFYRAASHGQRLRRRLEPWRLVAQGRGWYVVGFDRDREEPRVFRLSRIELPITLVGSPGDVVLPDPSAIRDVAGPARAAAQGSATLALRPERGNLLRRRGTPTTADARLPGWDVIHLDYADVEELAEEVAGLADAVVVLAPDRLRHSVLARLRAVAGADAAAPTGAESARADSGGAGSARADSGGMEASGAESRDA